MVVPETQPSFGPEIAGTVALLCIIGVIVAAVNAAYNLGKNHAKELGWLDGLFDGWSATEGLEPNTPGRIKAKKIYDQLQADKLEIGTALIEGRLPSFSDTKPDK